MDFEFHPFGQPGGGSEAGEAHGFGGIHGPAGVGQQQVFILIDEFQNVGKGIPLAAQVRAAQGDGDDFRAAGRQGLAHGFQGRKFSRAEKQTGTELAAGDDQWGHGRWTLE